MAVAADWIQVSRETKKFDLFVLVPVFLIPGCAQRSRRMQDQNSIRQSLDRQPGSIKQYQAGIYCFSCHFSPDNYPGSWHFITDYSSIVRKPDPVIPQMDEIKPEPP